MWVSIFVVGLICLSSCSPDLLVDFVQISATMQVPCAIVVLCSRVLGLVGCCSLTGDSVLFSVDLRAGFGAAPWECSYAVGSVRVFSDSDSVKTRTQWRLGAALCRVRRWFRLRCLFEETRLLLLLVDCCSTWYCGSTGKDLSSIVVDLLSLCLVELEG